MIGMNDPSSSMMCGYGGLICDILRYEGFLPPVVELKFVVRKLFRGFILVSNFWIYD